MRTLSALGLYDCARVDMRMDADHNLYVLEANSLLDSKASLDAMLSTCVLQ